MGYKAAVISVVVPVHNEERSVALLYDELQAALEPLDDALGGRSSSTTARPTGRSRAHAAARAEHERARRAAAPQLRQGGRARGRASTRRAATSSSRSTATSRTTPPRSRACSRSSTRASTSSRAGRRTGGTRSRAALLSQIFNRSPAACPGVRLHDMNCGLKAYRAEVVRGLRLYGELHRFMPVLAHYRGYRVAELPVNHRPREHGRSRYGVERYLRGFLDLLTVSFMGRYRHRPLHLFGGLGLLLGGVGFAILALPDRASRSLGQRSASGRCCMLGVLLVVVGMQFFSLGLVSEMITSHHEERARARPRRAARRRVLS